MHELEPIKTIVMKDISEKIFFIGEDVFHTQIVKRIYYGYARMTTLVAKVHGHSVFYHIAIIEGKDHYYQIMTWTLASRKQRYAGVMNGMIQSFREI